jgi:glycosyltransferase involved in cell wall biosynthesis
MNILILEPYMTGSHSAWAEGYRLHSGHSVEILALKGQFWKWRMHGGAVTLARQFSAGRCEPDVILATDMLDLSAFLSLTRSRTRGIPAAVYFHENQLCYPWSPGDRDVALNRDTHYGFINYLSALTADAVFFNSNYHRSCFLDACGKMLRHFPDHREPESVQVIADKSRVLPLGLDLAALDSYRPKQPQERSVPLVLWNHRWEYDKNPAEFFSVMNIMAQRGLAFEIALLGENFSRQPGEFEAFREKMAKRIVQFGYVNGRCGYARWLWRADILPVTSIHDFFGASVIEAVYCGVAPLLPERLAYPELMPSGSTDLFYRGFDSLVEKMHRALLDPGKRRQPALRDSVSRFDWSVMAAEYDRAFEKLFE